MFRMFQVLTGLQCFDGLLHFLDLNSLSALYGNSILWAISNKSLKKKKVCWSFTSGIPVAESHPFLRSLHL